MDLAELKRIQSVESCLKKGKIIDSDTSVTGMDANANIHVLAKNGENSVIHAGNSARGRPSKKSLNALGCYVDAFPF